jgi:molecular chaperone DnaK
MSEEGKKIYGIDLGTTYSCIAMVNEFGAPEIIKNKEGTATTPSVVFFEDENRVVGLEAKHMSISAPNQVVEGIKYHMGDSDYRFEYGGHEYRAEEISSYVLRKLVDDAQIYTEEPITDVVITCPAYFGMNEREATAAAGEIAGLKVHAILNEPTAAALSYSQKTNESEVVLVFDLGGGTFDITMIEIQPQEVKVIVTGGDHHLGGRLWDEAITRYLARQFQENTGIDEDPLDDDETRQDLFNKSEEAKKSLTAMKQTTVMIMAASRREKIILSREKFDELTDALLERAIQLTRELLEEANAKGYTKYDKFLLVGGSCKMPQVPARIQKEFGIEPIMFDPDESVAKGAALYGRKLQIGEMLKVMLDGWGEGAAQDPAKVAQAQEKVAEKLGMDTLTVQRAAEEVFINVTSRSFGVVALDQHKHEGVTNLVIKNTALPVKITQCFGTDVANMESADIRIMENLSNETRVEIEVAKEIGLATLSLPAGLPENSPIEITFTLDEQGRLHALAQDLVGNRTVVIDIETASVISQKEKAEAIQRSKKIAIV